MKTIISLFFIFIFFINFISADTCSDLDKTIEEFNLRLSNVESKIDNTENNYQLIPSVLQKLSNMETDMKNIMNQKDGISIYIIPGSIVLILIIILVIVIARKG